MTKCTCPLCKRDERKIDEVLDEIQRIYNAASYNWDLCVKCGDDAALEVNDLKYCDNHLPDDSYVQRRVDWAQTADPAIAQELIAEDTLLVSRWDLCDSEGCGTIGQCMVQGFVLCGEHAESVKSGKAGVFKQQKFTCMICKQVNCEGHVIRNDIPDAFLKAFEGETNA
jgi:hypothetical protein